MPSLWTGTQGVKRPGSSLKGRKPAAPSWPWSGVASAELTPGCEPPLRETPPLHETPPLAVSLEHPRPSFEFSAFHPDHTACRSPPRPVFLPPRGDSRHTCRSAPTRLPEIRLQVEDQLSQVTTLTVFDPRQVFLPKNTHRISDQPTFHAPVLGPPSREQRTRIPVNATCSRGHGLIRTQHAFLALFRQGLPRPLSPKGPLALLSTTRHSRPFTCTSSGSVPGR